MPFYDYSCLQCNHDFEKMLPMSRANEAQTCPRCQSGETRKKMSAFAVGGSAQARLNSAPAPRFT